MKRMMKRLLLVGTVAMALVGCSASNPNSSASSSNGSEKTINWTDNAEITTANTIQSSDSSSFHLLGNIEEGLYEGINGKIELGVLASKPKISEDGKTYTYSLRKNAKWSNGDPVTAHDFVFAWRKLVDPKEGAPYAYLMDGVFKNASEIMDGKMKPEDLAVKAVDDYTLEVVYDNPVPYLEGILSLPPFFPVNEKFYNEQGDKYGTSDKTLLSNGPFKMENWDGTGTTWDLVKNKTYWDKDNVKVDKVHFQVLKEQTTALNLFDSGEIDYAPLSGDYVIQRKDDPNLKNLLEGRTLFLKYNQERDGKKTPLANKDIRKAITQAIDINAYVKDVTQDNSKVLPYFVPSGLSKDPNTGKDFNASAGEGYLTFDAKKANESFQKGLKALGKKDITLEFLTEDTDEAKKGAQFFQQQLQDNLKGLKIKVVTVPKKNKTEADVKQNYDIQFSPWGADYPDPINFLELFQSNSNHNNTGYNDAQYDKLITDARLEQDVKKRSKLLTQAQRKLLIDDVVIGSLYQLTLNYLENPKISGVEPFSIVGPGVSFKHAEITD